MTIQDCIYELEKLSLQVKELKTPKGLQSDQRDFISKEMDKLAVTIGEVTGKQG